MIGIALPEIKCSYKQFFTIRYPIRSLINVVKVITSSMIRILLGRNLKYSFAFTGEDRIIEGIIKPIINKPGIYVDVGCNHPKFFSNTYGLYRKGWRGICIDANEGLIGKYRILRPRDIARAEVVSNKEEVITFYEIENDVLSTLVPSNLEEAKKLGLSHKVVNRKSTTLTSILSKHSIDKNFDLLSIDAEEHDFEVLESLDFSMFCPKMIVVEDESFDFMNYTDNRFVNFLTSKNYKMIAHVLTNSYFVKDD